MSTIRRDFWVPEVSFRYGNIVIFGVATDMDLRLQCKSRQFGICTKQELIAMPPFLRTMIKEKRHFSGELRLNDSFCNFVR